MTNIKVIAGANFGDEGKGLLTNYFCNEEICMGKSCINILSNGGSQRGHTVETDDGFRHVYHHFGSGNYSGVDTYFSSDFIVSPMTFEQEYPEVKEHEVFCRTNVIWSTPYDILANQVIEDGRGKDRHGSCGAGVWETICRHRNTTLDMPILNFYMSSIPEKIRYLYRIQRYYIEERLGIENIPDDVLTLIQSDDLKYKFIQTVEFFCDHCIFKRDNLFLNKYDSWVFENGQGLLLDQSLDSCGYRTTPSNTGVKNALEMIEQFHGNNVEVVYVSRSYLTKHGAGYFPNECSPQEIGNIESDMTNVPNPCQGSIRYAPLNMKELLKRVYNDYANVMDNGNRWCCSLAFTHLNEVNVNFDKIDLSEFKNIYKSYDKYSVRT